MYIYNYSDYLLLEHSKSDPIPELTWNKKGKTVIFLLGIPGAGKSTFIKKFLITRLKDYKIFDPDELQKNLMKLGKIAYERSDIEKDDKKKTIRTALDKFNNKYGVEITLTDKKIEDIINNNLFFLENDKILEKQFLLFLEHSNSDVVYDTTGTNINNIKKYTEISKDFGYSVLYIKVKSTVEYAVKGNLMRPRTVQPDYQLSTIEKSEKLERDYLNLGADAYYIYNREKNEILPAEEYWQKDSKIASELIKKDNIYFTTITDILEEDGDDQKIKIAIYNICKLIYNKHEITSLNRNLVDDVYKNLEDEGIFND